MRLSLIDHPPIYIAAQAEPPRDRTSRTQKARPLQGRVVPRPRARAGERTPRSQGAPHGPGRLQARHAHNGLAAVDPRLHFRHRAGHSVGSVRRARRLTTPIRRAGCTLGSQAERSQKAMTTPHPQPDTCPGCGNAHAPHPDLGVWCTRACIEARLRAGAEQQAAPKPRPARKRKPRVAACEGS